MDQNKNFHFYFITPRLYINEDKCKNVQYSSDSNSKQNEIICFHQRGMDKLLKNYIMNNLQLSTKYLC